MTIKEALSKIGAFAQKTLKSNPTTAKAAETPKVVAKINETFSKQNLSKVAGKVAGAAAVANITDTLLKDVPVANNIYAWYATTMDKMYEATIRKVPGFGDVLRSITDFINRICVPNAQKEIEKSRHANNPEWYLSDQARGEFAIPFNYNDADWYDYGENITSTAVNVIRLQYNPYSSTQKQSNRLTQMLTLLKGIRGLSGKLPYTKGDLQFYDWNFEYMVNEYYRLKLSLKLANMYDYHKARIPFNILRMLGWNPDDFTLHIAEYKQLLVNMYNTITQTYPKFGRTWKRLEVYWNGLYPDSSDTSVAALNLFECNITTLIPDRINNNYMVYYPMFDKQTSLSAGATSVTFGRTIIGSTSYAVYSANYNQFCKDIERVPQSYDALIGDIFGAVGDSAFWNDSKINDINLLGDKCVKNIVKPFDELLLTQIQNGTNIDMDPVDIIPGVGVVAGTTGYPELVATLPAMSVDSVSDTLNVTGNYAAIRATYYANNSTSTAGTMYLPATDGMIVTTTAGDVLRDSTIVVSNERNLDEGEQYEIIQLMAWFTGMQSSGHANNRDTVYALYETNSIFIDKVECVYYDPSTNQDYSVRLCSTAARVESGVTAFNTAVDITLRHQFWSQLDYGIKMNTLVIDSSGASAAGKLLLDFNIMGTISHKAYSLARQNTAYALYGADFKLSDKASKVSNIKNVYKAIS